MSIHHFLIHALGRKPGAETFSARPCPKPRAAGALEAAWLEALNKSYGDKTDKRFGFLADADKPDSFAGRLKAAVAEGGATLSGEKFAGFSAKLVEDLAAGLNDAKLSFSANVLFAHYAQGMTEYLSIAVVSESPGFAVDEALCLEEIQHLDFGRTHFALRLNLSEWLRNASATKYLSCVSGRGNARVGEVLLELMGFEESARSVEETAQLVRAFEAYCEAQDDSGEATALKQKAYDYCSEQLKSGTPVALGDLSAYLDAERPDAFVKFARDSEYQLPEEMPLEKKGLRKLVKFSAQTSELSITFSASLFGNSITYDAASDTLMITNLPPALRSQLLKG
ncbi:MAG: nucleoid-associated protein [Gammaproteobacteria bacterium]|nr:nucleoid-associated protein [Gammaproteobacteria bacterium]